MFGEDYYERDFGANDIVVELEFDNNCIVLDGSPLLKLQPGGYPSTDTILDDYGRNSRRFYFLLNPVSPQALSIVIRLDTASW